MAAVNEFARTLQKYMQKFGLESVDIAHFINSTTNHIDSLLDGTGTVELDTADKIARVFGLRYYEFAHPKQKTPAEDSLPELTKKRIIFRKKTGPHQRTNYQTRALNEKIIVILAGYEKDDEFLSTDILKALRAKFEEAFTTSEVTKRLTSHMTDYVEQTDRKDNSKSGRGRKPYYFKLIKPIPEKLKKETMKELEKAGNVKMRNGK